VPNIDIRLKCKAKGIPLWRVAETVGVSEPTLFRWLRTELDPEKRKLLLSAIRKIAKQK